MERLLERAGAASQLDVVARPVSKKVAALIPSGVVKDALSGTWLGHPLHPLLTDVPIGAWLGALVLDAVGGTPARPAAKTLVGIGVVGALPTALAGLSDWSDTLGEDRRIGFLHAAGNVAALGCFSLSWTARRAGRHRQGVRLARLGGAVAGASAYLGGHLAWRRGVNVNRHAWGHGSDQWVDAAAASDLDEDKPIAVAVGEDTVLLLRQAGGAVVAISDVCSHMGGPLHEGAVEGGCVTCPWHGSVFRLDDGSVVHGPATAPQPAYEARIAGDRVSVRRR